jgi:hypothetical protein
MIVLKENFSPFWKLTLKDTAGQEYRGNTHHFSANMYANAWYLPDLRGDYTFEIVYTSQKILMIGFLISGGVILTVLLLYLWRKKIK